MKIIIEIIKFFIRTIVIIFAILFAVTWGHIFQGDIELIRIVPAWIIIWIAVTFYRYF